MVGSCRNADDEARLAALKAYAQELGIAADVDWWERGGGACRAVEGAHATDYTREVPLPPRGREGLLFLPRLNFFFLPPLRQSLLLLWLY